MVFHNGLNNDYHFIIKELAKTFDGAFNCLGGNTGKCKTISVPITKDIERISTKMEKKTQKKAYLTNYNLLKAEDFWQAHYQILSTILLKEFIKLNVNMDMIIKKWQTCGIKYILFEYTNVEHDLTEYKCLCCNKNYQKDIYPCEYMNECMSWNVWAWSCLSNISGSSIKHVTFWI